MKSMWAQFLGALLAALAVAPAARAQEQVLDHFTTAQVVSSAIAGVPACIGWCAIGLCYWLRCTPFGCSIETTLRITHRYPDLVVTAWTSDIGAGTGGNPYVDVDGLYGAATYSLGASMMATAGALMGGGNSTPKDVPQRAPTTGHASASTEISARGELAKPDEQRHRNLRFKQSMAVGHPLDAVNPGGVAANFASIPALCPSEAIPYQLYYSSEADAINWRTGLVDMIFPETWIPGIAEVGVPNVNVYGNIYPRTGFLVQPVDHRAGAVAAQRTVDIVTRPLQPRIYMPLDRPDTPTWALPPPGPSVALMDRWQMISPLPEAMCHPFGVEQEALRNNTSGAYGWHYWQKYECCINNPGAIFLFPTYVNIFCLAL